MEKTKQLFCYSCWVALSDGDTCQLGEKIYCAACYEHEKNNLESED